MKVLGYRMLKNFGSVTVAERAFVDLPLSEVFRAGIGSLQDLRHPGMAAGLAEGSEAAVLFPKDEGQAFCFVDDDGRERTVHGAIFYESILGLASFLFKRYTPTGGGEFNAFMRRMRQSRVTQERLGEEIERMMAVELPPFAKPQLSGWDEEYPESPHHPLINANEFLKSRGIWKELPTGSYFLRYASEYQPIVVLPVKILRNQREIPRLAILSPLSHGSRYLGDASSPRLLFDGERHRWLSGLEEIPIRLQDAFSRDAVVFQEASFDIYPSPHLKARCLVRLPGQEEVGNLIDRDLPQPRTATLRIPAIVKESREPVDLGQDIPVVESPEEACFVLSRIVRGIYLPDDAPRPVDVSRIEGGETYLVLCEPREIA